MAVSPASDSSFILHNSSFRSRRDVAAGFAVELDVPGGDRWPAVRIGNSANIRLEIAKWRPGGSELRERGSQSAGIFRRHQPASLAGSDAIFEPGNSRGDERFAGGEGFERHQRKGLPTA